MKLEDLRKISAQFPQQPAPENYEALRDYLRSLGLDPDNMYQELEMGNPYVQAHQDVSYSNTMVQLHSHAFYEVLCCRNTCGAEYLVGSERYRLQKGDIILVPPGISHRPLLPESMAEPYIRDILWFSPEFIALMEDILPSHRQSRKDLSTLLRTTDTRWDILAQHLRTAVTESERQRPGWEAAVMGTAMVFLTGLKRALSDKYAIPMAAEKPGLLDRAMAYMEANLSSKITLEDMARHLYVSKSTVSQTFRNRMGVSFYRCLTQRRLIAAKSLIGENVPMEEVSRRVGFSDYSSFYRAFRQEYGISPQQYRAIQK